jgi:ornithine cyclodeaminase/alanine dehydrogenase-like protein (mu-crystallin family)
MTVNTAPLFYFSADQVRRALPMTEAIAAMRHAFAQLSSGQVTLPVRQSLPATAGRGDALVMACHSAAERRFSLKFVTTFPDNPRQGLPTVQALVILTDGTTGAHLAVMDGASLTAIRTGAASGLATDLLARPDAGTVAVFGAGVQAHTQLEAVCCVRTIRRASVYDPDSNAAEDHRASALEEAGDLLQPLRQGLIPQSHFGTELGDVVLGRSPGRRHADEITLFKSVGVAIQDLCAAGRVLANARELGLGVQMS